MNKVIKFKERLVGVSVESGLPVREGYEKGYAEGRGELERLKVGLVERVGESYEGVIKEIVERLPKLVMKVVERVLGDVKLEVEQVVKIVEEVLRDSAPEGERLEVYISEGDYKLLTESGHEILRKYSKVIFEADRSLGMGDCRVVSRFGVVDACVGTKLEQIEEELSK